MKKLKNGFRKVSLIATVISLVFASCKQPQNESKTEKFTVKVEHDVHITKTPSSLELQKGGKYGFTQLEGQMKLEFAQNYELAKITLNNASGKEITDSEPHIFNEETTIFLSSQKKGSGAKPQLTGLKVNGKDVKIADVMDAGRTNEEKVSIKTNGSPAGATIVFTPTLKDDKYWNLELGRQSLIIKVKKGSDEKEYTLNIERLDADTAVLKKLTIGGKTKEGVQITEEMTFTVPKATNNIRMKTQRRNLLGNLKLKKVEKNCLFPVIK